MTIEAASHTRPLEARSPDTRLLESRPLEAGGTTYRPDSVVSPAAGRRVRLLFEIGLFFIAGPLAIRYAIFGLGLPLFTVLAPVFVALLLYLLWDDSFNVVREVVSGFALAELVSMLVLFAVLGGAMSLFVALVLPEQFLALPLNRPKLWRKIMILYPIMSVAAQELIFRTFFFHRYGPLFGRSRWMLIGVNAAAFGLAHIIYGSYVSLILTTVLGVLLAWRYERTRSFWAVWLEHALYGCLVFTIGLGAFFFTGVANVN